MPVTKRCFVLVQEIKDLIGEESRRDHSNADAFILFAMSHGEKDVILGVDEEPVNIEHEIIDVLGACSTLRDKPKMLFFQASRGMRQCCRLHSRSYIQDLGLKTS